MNLNNESISQHQIDGQYVYILDTKAFDLLINEPVIEDQPIKAFSSVCNMMKFVCRNSSFYLAFYTLGNQKKWMFCLLLNKNEKLQRVQLENASCTVCDWKGVIANPTIPELYYGCPDRWAALENANRIPSVHCPKCNSILPRHSIWVGN